RRSSDLNPRFVSLRQEQSTAMRQSAADPMFSSIRSKASMSIKVFLSQISSQHLMSSAISFSDEKSKRVTVQATFPLLNPALSSTSRAHHVMEKVVAFANSRVGSKSSGQGWCILKSSKTEGSILKYIVDLPGAWA